jgi:hypothetical protein
MGTLARELLRGDSRPRREPRRPEGLARPLGKVARREDAAERGREPLEPPFAFLAAQGLVAPGALLAAQARARALDVGVDDALIAAQAVDEATLARAFARRWRLPFLPDPRPDAANGPGVFAAGLASVEGEGPRFAVVPRGLRGQALLRALRRPGPPPDGRVAVAPADALRAAAFAALGPRLAREAATSLPDDLAARRLAIRPAQATVLLATAVTILLALAASGALRAAAMLALGFFFLLAVGARLASTLAARDEPPDAPPLAERDLPRYAVVVAMHREEDVVADLVAALARFDYPREKLRVSLVVEEDDAPTRAALAALHLPAHMEVVVVAPGRPRTKPRALNVALAACDAELLVIYDAEDRPQPDQLRKAAARFAAAPASLACLQARLAIDNARESLLTRLFALDYAGLFEIANPGLAALGWPMLLGGTSNHFRVSTLRALGGWDAWNVTEDADLGLRLARAGYGVETLRSVTWEEAPVTLSAWAPQRRRWLKGWMQTALVHTRDSRGLWRRLGPERALAILATLGGGLLGALFGPVFALRVALDAARGDLLRVDTPLDVAATAVSLTLIVFAPVCAIRPPALGARRARLPVLLRAAPLLPLYHLLVSWAAWRALIELARDPHRWAKTRHGVSRARSAN